MSNMFRKNIYIYICICLKYTNSLLFFAWTNTKYTLIVKTSTITHIITKYYPYSRYSYPILWISDNMKLFITKNLTGQRKLNLYFIISYFKDLLCFFYYLNDSSIFDYHVSVHLSFHIFKIVTLIPSIFFSRNIMDKRLPNTRIILDDNED